ncbi:hypothetical protein [Occallatibacter savannae]|uniref:hypothetical protein n=1 Tax=Occallatibacter savannae TaxID=1002691 RepID=UPI0013A5A7B5|nr:hypothetical protein [Occallatibacter savannae]
MPAGTDHAWLNGSYEYMSDDPNFNPNGQLNGDWNQLQLVRPQPLSPSSGR